MLQIWIISRTFNYVRPIREWVIEWAAVSSSEQYAVSNHFKFSICCWLKTAAIKVWTHVCMCIYLYIYIWIYIDKYTYIGTYLCSFIWRYICTYICTLVFVRESGIENRKIVCTQRRIQANMHTYIFICTFVDLYICTYVHTYK